MTVTHHSECGKEKLKSWHVVSANSGNPECLVIATRRSRRGNPVGLNKMHLCLAGLLHFVRNDGDVSLVLLDCFTSFAMTALWIPVIATRLQLRVQRGRGKVDAAIQNASSLR
jgi:hypothetical protein